MRIDDGRRRRPRGRGHGAGPPLLLVHGFGGAKEDFADHVGAPRRARHGRHRSTTAATARATIRPTRRAYSLDRLARRHARRRRRPRVRAVPAARSLDGRDGRPPPGARPPERGRGAGAHGHGPGPPPRLDPATVELGAEIARTRRDGGAEGGAGRAQPARDPGVRAAARRRGPATASSASASGQRLAAAMWIALGAEIVRQPDQLEALRAVRCPTLVIVGEQDEAVPRRVRARWPRRSPGRQLVVDARRRALAAVREPAGLVRTRSTGSSRRTPRAGVSPPTPGTRRRATLPAHGVDTLFTLNGGHLWPLYYGVRRRRASGSIDTRHEQTAGVRRRGMGEGDPRARRGGADRRAPGSRTASSALTTAYLNGSPVVVVGGRAPQGRWGVGSLQELDHVPIVASITKQAGDRDRSPTGSRRSSTPRSPRRPDPASRTRRSSTCPSTAGGRATHPCPTPPDPGDGCRAPCPTPTRRRAWPASPVEPAGPSSWRAPTCTGRAPTRSCAPSPTRRGCPVFVNDMARGVIPADDALAFSRARGLAFAERRPRHRGRHPARLPPRLRRRSATPRSCTSRDAARRTARPRRPSPAAATGDLRRIFADLAERRTRRATRAAHGQTATSGWRRCATRRTPGASADEPRLGSAATPIDPVRVYGELAPGSSATRSSSATAATSCRTPAGTSTPSRPGCFLGPGPYGCLGAGMGYALAAALAQPDRQVVALFGDGALGFTLGDLDTLARHHVDVTAIVGNNGIWGLEKHPMQLLFGEDLVADLAPETRYDPVGRGARRARRAGARPRRSWVRRSTGLSPTRARRW